MKTLEDERYVVIKAYKCTVSEIWRDSFVLAYIACTSYPYIQSLPTLRYACVQIAVEGNIASGKSTLLNKLSQLETVEVREIISN